jgi:hypothetical protein
MVTLRVWLRTHRRRRLFAHRHRDPVTGLDHVKYWGTIALSIMLIALMTYAIVIKLTAAPPIHQF